MLNLKQIVSAIKGSNPFCTKDVKEQSKANKLDRQAGVAFFLYFRFKSVAKYMYKLLQSDKTHFTF